MLMTYFISLFSEEVCGLFDESLVSFNELLLFF